ncbi:bile acid:sodium symporter family protein [Variovorax saccharolyticus]|uniref:bile acid:sodium symporter family protein n=1 Tax=Variovorax saccharolyticus TaxID=3053516 RepID=UPI002578908C|nr:bile acid:sodium symporter [Variovorax sp. J31P216]MDM0026242.1 bile acid:sodium symporter [Variovorax sp. J31P216]
MLAVQASIVITVFGYGLEATLDDVLYVVRRPLCFLRSFVAMFLVMPLLAIGLDLAFDLRREIEVALVALSLSPVPPLLMKKQGKAGGRESYGLGLLVTMGVLSVVITPIGMMLMTQAFGRQFELPLGAIALVILKAVLLPLAAGMVVQALLPRVAARIARPAAIIGTVLLAVVALLIVFASRHAILGLFGNGTLLALIAFIVAGLAAGHWLGGPDAQDRVVLALSTASRHPGIALALATINFPNEPGVTAAILLYLLVNVLVSMVYVTWQRKRIRSAAAA